MWSTSYNNLNGLQANLSNYTNLTSNTVRDNKYGFYLIATSVYLSGGQANNNTLAQYQFDTWSNVTFTGVNRALSTPSQALDLNITDRSNVTTLVDSTYNNFTTDFGSIFFDKAINVSMKVTNYTNAGLTTTGCTGFTGTCTLISLSNYIVNITNMSGTASMNLGIFYDITSNPANSIFAMAKYNGSGWQEVGQTTIDTSNGSIRVDSLTSFSHFGIARFTQPSTPPSSDTPDNKGPLVPKKQAGCQSDDECSSSQYCSDGQCLAVTGQCGYADDHNWVSYECCSDSDCSDETICSSNQCIAVSGECGHAQDHQWVPYACCSDNDCSDGFECSNNNCVKQGAGQTGPKGSGDSSNGENGGTGGSGTPIRCSSDSQCKTGEYCESGACRKIQECNDYHINSPEKVNVGEVANIEVTGCGKPAGEITVVVTDPQNKQLEFRTDSGGKAVVTADFEGMYKLEFKKNSKVLGVSVFEGAKSSSEVGGSRRGIFGLVKIEEYLPFIVIVAIIVLFIGYFVLTRKK